MDNSDGVSARVISASSLNAVPRLRAGLCAIGNRARAMSSTMVDGSTSASSSSVTVETDTRSRCRGQELQKSGLGCSTPILFGRPTKRREERRRVEDVPLRPVRPFAFDEADDRDPIEFAVTRGLIVEQLHAVAGRIRQERLLLNPPVHRAGHLRDGHRSIVVLGVRRRERLSGPPEPRRGLGRASVRARRAPQSDARARRESRESGSVAPMPARPSEAETRRSASARAAMQRRPGCLAFGRFLRPRVLERHQRLESSEKPGLAQLSVERS